MSVSPARALALKAIGRVRRTDAWAHEILSRELAASPLCDRDVALATKLVYGVVEMGGVIDEVLLRHVIRPGDVEPKVFDALRLAAYELLRMDTAPEIVVDQGVRMAGSATPRAKGLANAVLRKIAAEAADFPFGDPENDPHALARLCGFPYWLAERLTVDLGADSATRMLRAHLAPAPLYLAHNPLLGDEESLFAELSEAQAAPVRFGPPGCIRCDAPAPALRSAVVAEGRAIVADAAAQAIVDMLPLRPHMRVVDVGAGRGGKTALIAFAAARRSLTVELTAVDIHDFKGDVLQRRMSTLGVDWVDFIRADVAVPDQVAEVFSSGGPADLVFVDAPCSGAGTLRRNPEKRWRMTASEIDEVAELGERMLRNSSALVRSGGFVVYSTCTVFPRENAEVITSFLGHSAGNGFELAEVFSGRESAFEDFLAREGMLQTIPECGGPDGHFAAMLRRR